MDSDEQSGPDEANERPWTEAQWEKFLEQADLRSARYGELFETLIDHPERDRLIRREMGWRFDEETEAELDRLEAGEVPEWIVDDDDEPSEELEEGATFEPEDPADVDDDEEEDLFAEYEGEMMEIPAYARTMQAASRIDGALKELIEQAGREEDSVEDEDLSDASFQLMVACAKIANGHGMGYEDEVLCGNIVQCRRALAASEACERGLRGLIGRGMVEKNVGDELLREADGARQAIQQRITELRQRVWW